MKIFASLFSFFGFLLLTGISNGQNIILLQENFDSNPCTGNQCYADGYNGWNVTKNVNNNGLSNRWFVSSNENGGGTIGSCGQRIGGSANGTLHIGTTFAQDSFGVANGIGSSFPCTTGDCGDTYFSGLSPSTEALYGATVAFQTDISAESPSVNCTAFGCPIYLSFYYMNNAIPGKSNLSIEYWSGGTNWISYKNIPVSDTCVGGDGKWANYVTALPADALNNPDVRIAFLWTNDDDSTGTHTSAAIDSVVIFTTATPGIDIQPIAGGCVPITDTIHPTVVDPTYNYLWTINNGTPRASNNLLLDTIQASFTTTGSIPVYLNVTNGTCSQTDTAFVVVNDCNTVTAAFIPGDTSICQGACLNFTNNSASALPLQYAWTFNGGSIPSSTSQSPPQVCYNTAGAFPVKLVVTDIYGKKDSATHTITVNAPPVLVTSNDTAICTGTSANLTVSGATSYTWAPSTGLTDTTSSSITAAPATATTYTVTGTSNGCTSTKTIAVTLNPLPVITTSADTSICPGTNASLSASGATTYSWAPNTGLNNTTSATVTASPGATTTYTVTGTANGCSVSTPIIVSLNAAPVLTTSADTAVCNSNPATLTVSGAVNYTWAPASSLDNSTGSTVTATPASTTTYTVTGTNAAGGCSSTKTITVTVDTPPVLATSAPATLCTGGSATLTVSGASTYTWAPGTGLTTTTGSSTSASPATSTTYTVTGSTAGGCTASKTISVTIISCLPIVADFSFDSIICENDCIQFTDKSTGNPVSWKWTLNGSNPDTSNHQNPGPVCFATAGVYDITLTATGLGGNSDVATKQITVQPGPVLTVNYDTLTITEETSVKLKATGGKNYKWTPDAFISSDTVSDPTVTPLDTTVYTVTSTDPNGCSAKKEVTINVIKNNRIFGPNTFSPNGDGLNDFFRIYVYGHSPVTQFEYTVYDRWGTEIFYTNEINAPGWDGTSKGRNCPVGTYVWFYRIKFADSREVFTGKGDVTLMR